MRKDEFYLGIDVGSVSTNLVLTDLDGNLVKKLYLRTGGQPIKSLIEGLKKIAGLDQEFDQRFSPDANPYGKHYSNPGVNPHIKPAVNGDVDVSAPEAPMNGVSGRDSSSCGIPVHGDSPYGSPVYGILPRGVPTIAAAGATGSGRGLAGVVAGADVIKNEITAHAIAAQRIVPGVRTILEIGGQDSKIIILRNGVVYDFAMNTVCAAGTGSFLDRQAARLGVPIEEFGDLALRSESPVRIAGRCAVFAESDMIHKQQSGHSNEDIVNGLCEALVRNYLNNLAKGKEILEPVVFQGGVAANKGIAAAFERALGVKVIIPEDHAVMGAYGAALFARQARLSDRMFKTRFCGFEAINKAFVTKSRECDGCANICEIVELFADGKLKARWGDRCGKWSNLKENGNICAASCV